MVRRSSSGPSLGGNGARRARVSLVHPDAATARRTIARCLAEVRRLEGIFSLYLADSAVSRLNRAGVLRAPPFELLEVLDAARTLTRLSHGAFDVRVQPLWAAHASRRWDELEPAVAALTGDITATATQIRSERPDMALTFNGIAQGYITDRETGLLADDGFAEMFVDLGEMRATGWRAPGRRWRVRLAGAADAPAIELDRRAMATSEPAPGSTGDAPVHLLDPAEGGRPPPHAAPPSSPGPRCGPTPPPRPSPSARTSPPSSPLA